MDSFNYLGGSQLGYPAYADVETGTMLIADPGGRYKIRAVEPGHPVPPGDGRWAAPPPPVIFSPPPAPAAAAPASVPGGDI